MLDFSSQSCVSVTQNISDASDWILMTLWGIMHISEWLKGKK